MLHDRGRSKASSVDRVIVSTDYKSIAKISLQAGAEVPFLRPKYLATDTAHSPDVVEHAINFIEKEETEFLYSIMLQPTSPFERINTSMKLLKSI